MHRLSVVLSCLAAAGAFTCLSPAVSQESKSNQVTADPAPSHRPFASGPLRVQKRNPRYFEDAEGRPVCIAGDSEFLTVMDTGFTDPPGRFDFQG